MHATLMKLTIHQLNTLAAYAKKMGPNWKTELVSEWLDGYRHHEFETCYLQQIRNTLGPVWLEKVPADVFNLDWSVRR